MDILYILGRGSKHDNLELRLSLRTLETNGKHIDRLFIVGNKPDWVKNAIHIPAEDTYQPMNNHCHKVLKAISWGISDNFLLMNDDFFMLKPFDAEKYPYYYRGEMTLFEKELNGGKLSQYHNGLNRTYEMLKSMGIEKPLLYNVHCPIIYNSEKFSGFSNLFQETKFDDVCFSWRCLYGNMHATNPILVEDCKDFNDEWKIPETGCLSTSDNCDKILEELEKQFNKKSRWEK